MSGEYGTELGDKMVRDVHDVIHDFDPVYDVECFHRMFEQFYVGKPRMLDDFMQNFRDRFLQEELDEYREATEGLAINGYNKPDSAKACDALVDLVYVALGTAHLHGYNFREAWRRVHRANMSKVLAGDAKLSQRGYAFDVIKPAGWKAPDHTDLV